MSDLIEEALMRRMQQIEERMAKLEFKVDPMRVPEVGVVVEQDAVYVETSQTGGPYTDVMIDLETLGVYPGSVILSIGAQAFNLDHLGLYSKVSFYANIDVMNSQALGMSVDEKTRQWWSEQGEETKMALNNPLPVDLRVAMNSLVFWFDNPRFDRSTVRVWSHGAAFDLAMLRWAERRLGITLPWNFRNERDTRTMLMVAELIGNATYYQEIMNERYGRKHHAGDDAIKQAIQMQKCRRAIIAATKNRT